MAKDAKHVEVEIKPTVVNSIAKKIHGLYDDIMSAQASYMNRARRIRESIDGALQEGKARGVPVRVMKLQIKIEQTTAKLSVLMAELQGEERKQLLKVAKIRGDRAQLSLFADLPPPPKPPKVEAKPKKEKAAKAAKPKEAKTNGTKESKPAAPKRERKKHPGVLGSEIPEGTKTLAEAAALGEA